MKSKIFTQTLAISPLQASEITALNYGIDLHMHSLYSDDGEYTPKELVGMCHKANIEIMAISDHNCIKANELGQREAERLNIKYIPAVELDCTFLDVNLHVLGYWIDYHSADFEAVEENIRKQGRQVSQESLRLTKQLGFLITEEELDAVTNKGYWKGIWTGEAFAEVLLSKPEYMEHELLKLYRIGGSRSDNPYVNFYWDYYAQGKPCYAKMEYPTLKEAISIIKDNKGTAVLAHPGNNLKNHMDLLNGIIDLGIDGIEVFSSYHDRQTMEYFYNESQKYGLMITCGSDFHGATKPSIQLGESGCFVERKVMEKQLGM